MNDEVYFYFWACTFGIGGKMGVATTRAPNGLGPPDPTKKLAPPGGVISSINHQAMEAVCNHERGSVTTRPNGQQSVAFLLVI